MNSTSEITLVLATILVLVIVALGAEYISSVSDAVNVGLPLGILLATGLYIVLHVKLVGRNLVFAALSFSVAWLFLCQSPLYPRYFTLLFWGRWVTLVALVVVSFIAGIWAGKRLGLNSMILFFFFMVAFFCLTMFWSVDRDLTVDRSISVLLFAAAVVTVIWYTGNSKSSLDQAIKAVLLPIPLLFWILTGIYGFDLSYVEKGQLRTPGPMLNPNGIGVLGALLAPVAYYLWQTARPRSTFWLGSLLTFITMVILSGTRGALAAALAALTFIALLRMHSLSMGVLLSGALASIGFLVIEIYGLPEIVLLYLRPDSFATGSGRAEAWAAAVEILRESPWVGHGFGTEDLLFELFRFRFLEHSGAMVHNSYLGLSLQIGVPAAAIFFLVLIFFAIKGFQASRRSKSDFMLSSLVGTLIASLVVSLTESWLYSAGNSQSLPFWILFGILARLLIAPKPTVADDFATAWSRPAGKSGAHTFPVHEG